MNIYKNIYKTECIFFMAKDKQFLKKYNEIWKKISNRFVHH